MQRISVGLSAGLAKSFLEDDPRQPDATALHDVVRRGGAELVPQASGLRGEDLDPASDEITWFTAEVDDQQATELVNDLQGVPGVLSAFVAAPEGPP